MPGVTMQELVAIMLYLTDWHLERCCGEGKSPENYYDERYPQWKDSIASNAEIYNAMHRPKAEWREIIEAQKHSAARI